MPLPWEGGWWRLGDIVQYEITSTLSILKTASLHREEILTFRNDLCRKEVSKGESVPPFYYVIPGQQRDLFELVNLVNLMKEHGVEVYRLKESFTLSGKNFEPGDVVIPLAQPFRPFIKEVLEPQEYPVRHYTPGGEVVKPYDIASWSLPLHRGITSFEMKERNEEFEGLLEKIEGEFTLAQGDPGNFWAAIFTATNNGSFNAAFIAAKRGMKVERMDQAISLGGIEYPKGSFIMYGEGKGREQVNALSKELKFSPAFIKEEWKLKTIPFAVPRIALVETYFHDMDAGWTRYIFDTYQIPFTVLHPDQFDKTDFVKSFDVVIFPSTDKSVLMTGKRQAGDDYYMGNYHPDYVKGMGKKGMDNMMTFLDNGGIIVAWGSSAALFEGTLEIPRGDKKEEFQLPFRDISSSLQRSGLYVAGSLLEVDINADHPLTYGMPEKAGIYFGRNTVFSTSVPRFDTDRRVIAKFPEKDILLSGYSENQELLGNKSAMIWLKKGKGQLVLFGFNPQFRASTQGSYKLLFNSLLLPKIN